MGTFGGALEARGIEAGDGKLIAEVEGEIENEEGVLIIRRIHVSYLLSGSPDVTTVERVHETHKNYCPVFRSLEGSISITTEYRLK